MRSFGVSSQVVHPAAGRCGHDMVPVIVGILYRVALELRFFSAGAGIVAGCQWDHARPPAGDGERYAAAWFWNPAIPQLWS